MGIDWTQITNTERAMQSLAGICQGIAIDYEVSDDEIAELSKWLLMYKEVINEPPFSDLADLIARIVKDDRVEDDEREELLDWCQQYTSSDSVAVRTTTDALRRLHGLLHGIAADGLVTEQEAVDLREWLNDHEDFADLALFREVRGLVAEVLGDRRVDATELNRLLHFCQPYVERPAVTGSRKPVGHTLRSVCDDDAAIEFSGCNYLFTGKARRERKHLHAAVTARGGNPIERVRQDMHYLVVGALSQPAWAYSAYGRKIERVLELREQGYPIVILHEDRLTAVLGLTS